MQGTTPPKTKKARTDEAPAATGAGATASKRERILDAAERLFAEGGFDGVSMRDIAAAAGVGLPLIVYHFETKKNLYRALFDRYKAVLDARLAALRQPLAQGEDALEHIARAFVLPVIQGQRGAAGLAYARLIARETSDPREAERGIVQDYFDPFAIEFIRAIEQALPELGSDYAHWAYLFAVGALVMSVFDQRIERLSDGGIRAGDIDHKAEYLVRFIVAGIRAGTPKTDKARGVRPQ